ncbi:Conserved oligomeric Golgi complex subunit 1 [Porphyridium purpureum]|uniref:Conserved oligomeric Golgi complex subunit 1 n=1 Tax=Porphyridium purpureum TaxID=35688 RepID=A0A5J4YHC2_PORPP|nr:Conserved oligomeric Golgi complex subunit 1 [Porphyridium purpureum]|eukprot:POR4084..scf251_18
MFSFGQRGLLCLATRDQGFGSKAGRARHRGGSTMASKAAKSKGGGPRRAGAAGVTTAYGMGVQAEVAQIFRIHRVSEIRQIEASVRASADDKGDALQEMLSTRYRVLMRAADEVCRLHETAAGVQDVVAHLRAATDELNKSLAVKAASADTHSAQRRAEEESLQQRRAVHVIGSKLKFLVDTPEYLYTCLDTGKLYAAAVKIHQCGSAVATLSAEPTANAALPLMKSQWQAIEGFREPIILSALQALKGDALGSNDVAGALASIYMLADKASAGLVHNYFHSGQPVALVDLSQCRGWGPSLEQHESDTDAALDPLSIMLLSSCQVLHSTCESYSARMDAIKTQRDAHEKMQAAAQGTRTGAKSSSLEPAVDDQKLELGKAFFLQVAQEIKRTLLDAAHVFFPHEEAQSQSLPSPEDDVLTDDASVSQSQGLLEMAGAVGSETIGRGSSPMFGEALAQARVYAGDIGKCVLVTLLRNVDDKYAEALEKAGKVDSGRVYGMLHTWLDWCVSLLSKFLSRFLSLISTCGALAEFLKEASRALDLDVNEIGQWQQERAPARIISVCDAVYGSCTGVLEMFQALFLRPVLLRAHELAHEYVVHVSDHFRERAKEIWEKIGAMPDLSPGNSGETVEFERGGDGNLADALWSRQFLSIPFDVQATGSEQQPYSSSVLLATDVEAELGKIGLPAILCGETEHLLGRAMIDLSKLHRFPGLFRKEFRKHVANVMPVILAEIRGLIEEARDSLSPEQQRVLTSTRAISARNLQDDLWLERLLFIVRVVLALEDSSVISEAFNFGLEQDAILYEATVGFEGSMEKLESAAELALESFFETAGELSELGFGTWSEWAATLSGLRLRASLAQSSLLNGRIGWALSFTSPEKVQQAGVMHPQSCSCFALQFLLDAGNAVAYAGGFALPLYAIDSLVVQLVVELARALEHVAENRILADLRSESLTRNERSATYNAAVQLIFDVGFLLCILLEVEKSSSQGDGYVLPKRMPTALLDAIERINASEQAIVEHLDPIEWESVHALVYSAASREAAKYQVLLGSLTRSSHVVSNDSTRRKQHQQKQQSLVGSMWAASDAGPNLLFSNPLASRTTAGAPAANTGTPARLSFLPAPTPTLQGGEFRALRGATFTHDLVSDGGHAAVSDLTSRASAAASFSAASLAAQMAGGGRVSGPHAASLPHSLLDAQESASHVSASHQPDLGWGALSGVATHMSSRFLQWGTFAKGTRVEEEGAKTDRMVARVLEGRAHWQTRGAMGVAAVVLAIALVALVAPAAVHAGTIDDKIAAFQRAMLEEGFSEEALNKKLAQTLGAGAASAAAATGGGFDEPALKSSIDKNIKPHLDSLDAMAVKLAKTLEEQQKSLSSVDEVMGNVETTLKHMASNAQRFQTDIKSLSDLIDELQQFADTLQQAQISAKNEIKATSSRVTDFAERSSSNAVWYFLMLFEIVAVVGFLYVRHLRRDRKDRLD